MRTAKEFISLPLFLVLELVIVEGGPDPALLKYLQPDDVADGTYDNITTQDAEKRGLCTRPCENATRMVCYFHFTLENYATIGPACGACLNGTTKDCDKKGCITADGVERPILTINRRLPGPSIQVCRGDTIVVDVKNKIVDRAVTLHWHGVYQRHTPYSDGVPMVTQCPILPETTFRYKFPAMPYGSFFFHSHMAFQKMDGLESSLVIRRPKSSDPNKDAFDRDLPSHVVLIMDWLHAMTDAKFPGNTYYNVGTRTESFLINGRSVFVRENGTKPNVPYRKFFVDKDLRYRFRFIGGSCLACPFLVTIEEHKLLLIAVDGTPVENQLFDSLTIYPGDRMDVVIDTHNHTPRAYYMQVKTLCTPNVSAEAILQYNNADPSLKMSEKPKFDAFPRGRSLNALDESDCSADNPNVCWNHVNALEVPVEKDLVLKPVPDLVMVLAMDEYHYNQETLFWNKEADSYFRFFQSSPNVLKTHLMNNVTFMMPPFPVLPQDLPLPKDLVCPTDLSKCGNNADQIASKNLSLCECTDIVKVKLNDTATIIFVDWLGPKSIFEHPMHLHGTDIYVIEQGVIPANQERQDFITKLKERLAREGADLATKIRPKPCIKDTVTIPPNGYTVVRILFNNPGIWILHCHFAFHTETGMNKLFQVGERKDFVPVPKDFPTCNDYLPPVDPKEFDNIDWDDEPTVQKVPSG